MRPPWTYPPIGFRVFGLDEEWAEGRWLEMIEGSSTVAYGLRLGHGDRHRPLPSRAWAMVTSFDMPRLCRQSKLYPAEAAERAVMYLLDMTEPKLTKHERRRFTHNMIDRSIAEGDRYAEWPTSTWIVDGLAMDAHIFRWANAWTGFTIIDDAAVIVTAVRVAPVNLQLLTQTDALSYHFDLREPLVYPESIIRSQDRSPVRADDDWTDWPRHPDHNALLVET